MKFFAPAFSGTHARWFRFSIAPTLLLCILGFSLLFGGCSDDGQEIIYPTPPLPNAMNWLFDVFGTASNDVYACGNKGAMFHYDGTEWSFIEMGTTSPITTVWGLENGPLYAAGHEGNIWQLMAGSWSGMDSGINNDLYGLGVFDQSVYVCGADGALQRLSGNTWNDVGQIMVTRSSGEGHAVEDTFMLNEDVISLLMVNQHFLGGAYKLPDFEGEYIGLHGTAGMVMSTEPDSTTYDWELRPLGEDEFALSEWIMCGTNTHEAILNNNYLGTSEGWIFQLVRSDEGENVWSKMSPDATENAGSGIRDMWLDGNSNLYFVTDEGEMLFQSRDYNFSTAVGVRKAFRISQAGLSGIWGSDVDHIFMTGFTEDVIFEASMDTTNMTLNISEVPLTFPDTGGKSIGLFEDQFGMPRY